MKALKINQGNSYKIGLDEIEGLKDAMTEVMKPVLDHLKNRVYYSHYERRPIQRRRHRYNRECN